jgi:glycosyltransferase involved in cell wall biosynthesis
LPPEPPYLLVVADYPFVEVGGRVFAEVPWDQRLARTYGTAFQRILLVGRRRTADAAPRGWVPVETPWFEVVDAGDWAGPAGFLRNLPSLLRAVRAVWPRVGALYLKLFYLNSVAVWCYNRLQRSASRKPVATLLVGDAAEAVLLRDDLLPVGWARRMASWAVGAVIRVIQRTADVPGFWARFLERKFGNGRPGSLVVTEPWLRDEHIRVHDRPSPRRPPTVLFVGRLVQRKGAGHLLEAVGRLVGEGIDLRVMLVGDGPERAGLESLSADLGLGDRVRFTGWLGVLSPEILAAYDAADIFCLPSFAEGLPLVVVEAMGRGVPVVATAVSGTPEIVLHERTGLLVPWGDVGALTAAIRRYLTDASVWRACVDGGYDMARRYTFEAQRRRLADAIVRLVA